MSTNSEEITMNILFITLLNINELNTSNIYTDLLNEFLDRGHKLYIVSPVEKRYNQTTHLIRGTNYEILKLRIGNVTKTNPIEKGLSTLMLENHFIKGVKKYFKSVRFDLIIYSTPPITFSKTIKFIKQRDNAKSYLLLKDIFPQNAIDIGLLNKTGIKGFIYRYFRKREIILYKNSDYIGCMSKANVDYVLTHNDYLDRAKVHINPNSIRTKKVYYPDKKTTLDKYNIPHKKKVFIYGGNLGRPQGIDFLLKAISFNENRSNAFFVVVGDGTEYNKIYKFFDDHKIQNSKLIKFLSKVDYDELISVCDFGMIFLDSRFTIPNYPSRLLSYLEYCLPVIAATDENTDLKDDIINHKLGLWSKSGDLDRFNRNVDLMIKDSMNIVSKNNMKELLVNQFSTVNSYEIIMSNIKG